MTARRAKILLTNDDGIDAPGMVAMRAAMADSGHDVLVVAPAGERSATGCGLSIVKELRVAARRDESGAVWGYSVDGLPADCVKFAATSIGGWRPDLVLSGVNRGYNGGNSIFYSGTVGCAIEATFFGLRAMAVSLSYRKEQLPTLRFEGAARIAAALVPWLLSQGWRPRSFWNLNVPNIPAEDMGPIRYAHQGTSFYRDDFRMDRDEGDTRIFRNMGETLVRTPDRSDSDDHVIDRGSPALTMLSIDLTVDLPPAAAESLEHEWQRLLGAGK
jgi:5'-nucleotidase